MNILSKRSLPLALQEAVEVILDGESRSLRGSAADLSSAYGHAASSAEISVDAYLAARMPATYAAITRVFELVGEVAGDFEPASLLDVGAGPGTASWAAQEHWPTLQNIIMVERDSRFAAMASALAKVSHGAALRGAKVALSDLRALEAKADLVVAAYVFAEQAVAHAGALAERLWAACDGVLVIVEPGTPEGFQRIREARQALLKAGASMLAPCPHEGACPIAGEDWCHFKTRLPRSRLHMRAKGAVVPFEDESFSFVAVAREGRILPEARILAPPVVNKVSATLKLCTHEGIRGAVVASRSKAEYKRARKKGWGDFWP